MIRSFWLFECFQYNKEEGNLGGSGQGCDRYRQQYMGKSAKREVQSVVQEMTSQ